MTYHLKCPTCQRDFEHRRQITYCSVACANTRRGRYSITCLCCGESFEVRYKERQRTFCSGSCRTRFLNHLERTPVSPEQIQEAIDRTPGLKEAAALLGITYGLLHHRMHEYGMRKGRTLHPHAQHGYWPNKNKANHRRLVEEALGRKLEPGEVVHHIDGDIQNNAPPNLAVMSKSEHARLHRSLEQVAQRYIRAGLVAYDPEGRIYRHKYLAAGKL